jgi:hypothetical protein
MQESYASAVAAASSIAQEFVEATREDSPGAVRDVDRVLQGFLRWVGQDAFANIVQRAAKEACVSAKTPGMSVHRNCTVTYDCIFGPVEVDSPYLYDRKTGQSSRPVQDVLGIRDGGRSSTVERVLTDFGAEDSFGQAANRFEEHYGWHVDRGSVRRVTRKIAADIEQWVASRLESEEAAFSESLAARPGADQMLSEQDGSMVRTGVSSPMPQEETTPVRGVRRSQREERWREVRVGVTRQLDQPDAIYVAAMTGYPDLTRRLFGAAVSCGLSSRSETICIGDGANGLMEEMLSQFPNAMFILDRPHLVSHVHETAEEMGLVDDARADWVNQLMARIDRGEVGHAIAELRVHHAQGHDRARRLMGYLDRLRNCVHYDAYRKRGLPIGSGEVESAHRSIPQKRLKLPGACWHPDSINPMLALRVLRANDWWHEFWEQRTAA